MPGVMTNATIMEILATAIDTGGVLDGAIVFLWTGATVPSKDSVYADFTPVAFSGYAASAPLVWADPYLDYDGDTPTLTAPVPLFRSTDVDPFVPATVNGYGVIIPGTPNVLRWAERFDEPIYIDQPDRIVDVTLVIPGTALVEG